MNTDSTSKTDPAQPNVEAPRQQTRPRAATPAVPFTERLSENGAATLSYLFGWISGAVFLLVDRRPYVRYHAAQSVVVFAALSIVLLFLGGFFLGTFLPGDTAGGVLLGLRRIVELCWIALAFFLMLKAASGERYRLPLAAKYADATVRSSPALGH